MWQAARSSPRAGFLQSAIGDEKTSPFAVIPHHLYLSLPVSPTTRTSRLKERSLSYGHVLKKKKEYEITMTAYNQGRGANGDDRATRDPFQFHFLHTSVSCPVDKRVIVPGKTPRGPVVFTGEKKKGQASARDLRELHGC